MTRAYDEIRTIQEDMRRLDSILETGHFNWREGSEAEVRQAIATDALIIRAICLDNAGTCRVS